MTFYEDMVEAEKHHAAALEAFEKRCAAFVPWLLQQLCTSLGWPVEQFKRMTVPDRPVGSHPTSDGYVDEKGYVFAFEVDMWGRWAVDFKCSVAARQGDRFTVSVDGRSFVVADQDEDSLLDIVGYLRASVIDAGRKSNFAEVTSGESAQGPFAS